MSSFIMDFLSRKRVPDFVVHITSDLVTFTCRDETLTLRPVVYLSADEERPIVLAVGEEPEYGERLVRVDLFQAGEVKGQWKSDCLAAFFDYAFRKLRGHMIRLLLRPGVIFKNADSLNAHLAGYQEMILRQAVMGLAVRECRFEP